MRINRGKRCDLRKRYFFSLSTIPPDLRTGTFLKLFIPTAAAYRALVSFERGTIPGTSRPLLRPLRRRSGTLARGGVPSATLATLRPLAAGSARRDFFLAPQAASSTPPRTSAGAGGGGGGEAGAQAHARELGCHDGTDDGGVVVVNAVAVVEIPDVCCVAVVVDAAADAAVDVVDVVVHFVLFNRAGRWRLMVCAKSA